MLEALKSLSRARHQFAATDELRETDRTAVLAAIARRSKVHRITATTQANIQLLDFNE